MVKQFNEYEPVKDILSMVKQHWVRISLTWVAYS